MPAEIAPETNLPNGAKHGPNDFRRLGYGGPCPPGGTHRYFFKLYALDSVFSLESGATKAQVEDVKQFLRAAFYRRFGLSPDQEFVEPHPGGGAIGVRLSRFDRLPELILRLKADAARDGAMLPS